VARGVNGLCGNKATMVARLLAMVADFLVR
jgi:hypothetical protein